MAATIMHMDNQPAVAAVVSRDGADYMDEGGGEARHVSGKLIVSQVRYTSHGVVSCTH